MAYKKAKQTMLQAKLRLSTALPYMRLKEGSKLILSFLHKG